MIKSKKLLAVATFLLIGTQTMEAKENPGSLRAPVAANKVQAGCPKTTAQTDLSINNVRARILNGGDLWWNPNDQTEVYEVPSGSGKNSIYAGSIWVAGFDAGGNLKEACQTYRQGGANDFWSGPISKKPNNTIDVSTDVCSAYDRFWVLNRSDVEKFENKGHVVIASADDPPSPVFANFSTSDLFNTQKRSYAEQTSVETSIVLFGFLEIGPDQKSLAPP